MSKKKTKTEQEIEVQVREEITEQKKQDEPEKQQKKWAFPTVSKCPRCGTTETKATHTDGKTGTQYRQCQRAICRYNYSVKGTKV